MLPLLFVFFLSFLLFPFTNRGNSETVTYCSVLNFNIYDTQQLNEITSMVQRREFLFGKLSAFAPRHNVLLSMNF